LIKRFGKRTVIDDLSFTVPEGSVVGLLGPNRTERSERVSEHAKPRQGVLSAQQLDAVSASLAALRSSLSTGTQTSPIAFACVIDTQQRRSVNRHAGQAQPEPVERCERADPTFELAALRAQGHQHSAAPTLAAN
jgi:ABC-type Na+ transport system ATPase subunit NatA